MQVQPGQLAPFRLPPPRHADDAFEPFMDARSVRAMRTRQQANVDAVNSALQAHPQWLGVTIETLLRRLAEMPPVLRDVVAAQGAAHANHQFFWKITRPPPAPAATGEMLRAVERDFGSLAGLQAEFARAATGVAGGGWAFVVMDPADAMRLKVLGLQGDASVLPLGRPGLVVCDLWPRAWTARHRGLADWLAAFWQLVDWDVVAARRAGILQGRTQL